MNTKHSTQMTGVPALAGAPGYETILIESEIFNQWDINSLVELMINHYHFNTRENIIVIYDLAQKVSAKHKIRHPELTKLTTALFLFFDDLSFHMKKEEQILFPNITQLIKTQSASETSTYTTFGLIKESALMMQKEHQAAVKELMLFRQLTNNYMIPSDACMSYKELFERMKEFEKELMLHIHLENDILFPKAIQMDEQFSKKRKKQVHEKNSN